MHEVAEHYRHFDGVSPINGQNRALIDALRAEFARSGIDLPVYWGNRNWQPYADLPICIYNNPSATHFSFSLDLLSEIANTPEVAAVKMPLPGGGDFKGGIARLRRRAPADFRIGCSGEPGMAASPLAGANAFYSGIAGVSPEPLLRLGAGSRRWAS